MMVINSETDRKVILDAIKEYSNSCTRVDAEKDLQKNILEDTADKVGIPKKMLSKLATVYHKQNFQTVSQEQEEFEELYESVVTTNSGAQPIP